MNRIHSELKDLWERGDLEGLCQALVRRGYGGSKDLVSIELQDLWQRGDLEALARTLNRQGYGVDPNYSSTRALSLRRGAKHEKRTHACPNCGKIRVTFMKTVVGKEIGWECLFCESRWTVEGQPISPGAIK
jgi:hypothetical protein